MLYCHIEFNMPPKFPEQQKDKNNKRKNSPDSNEDTDNNEEQIFGLRRSPRKKMQRTDSDSLSQGASSVGDTPRPTPPAIGPLVHLFGLRPYILW